MVLGKDFAWAHIPKTAGDATTAYFRLFQQKLLLMIDPSDQPCKHYSFVDRGIYNDRKLILNIRRLPYLILSNAYQLAVDQLPDFNVNTYFKSVAHEDKVKHAGYLRFIGRFFIKRYTNAGSLKIDRYLRCENIQDDFLDFIKDYVEVTDDLKQEIRGMLVKERLSYDRNLATYWTQEDIDALYKLNPQWADLELEYYGSLIVVPQLYGKCGRITDNETHR